nr:peptidoglycan-binding domain-containing protein [Luteibacter sp. 9135]
MQLALADYDNQFTISGIDNAAVPKNSMLAYLEGNPVTLPGGTVQLHGDTITREDIQTFINATRYGVDHPTSVANRETRLENALTAMHLGTGQSQPLPSAPAAPVPSSSGTVRDATLREGMHDDADVRAMQTALSTLGYKDAQGRPLHADGDFGPATRHAVEAFQRDHALSADGVAGKDTLGALGAASALRSTVAGNDMQAATMDQPGHAGNAMYTQALAAVHRVDEAHGRTPTSKVRTLPARSSRRVKRKA